MSDESNFFRDWMDTRRLKAEDVAEALQVSEQTIHNWRSSGVPSRRVPHVERFMADWIDPSTVAPDRGELRMEAFVMKPSEESFDAWNRAANARGLTIREWITRTLEDAARDFLEAIPKPVSSTGSSMSD